MLRPRQRAHAHTPSLARHRIVCLLVAIAASLGAGTAQAEGDPAQGEAQAAPCAACHGQDGATGIDPTYPNIAGQNEAYLTQQLEMIQSGARNIPLMAGQLNGKTPQQLADLAAYYASLPAKVAQAQGSDEELSRAAAIYRGGILDKEVAACSACHSPGCRRQ